MNRKDDPFEVVFYPGADKREKGILGKILLQIFLTSIERAGLFLEAALNIQKMFRGGSFRLAEDTGGARLSVCRRKSETQLT